MRSSGTSVSRTPSRDMTILRVPLMPPQIERHRILDAAFLGRIVIDRAWRMTVILEARAPARFGLVRIHRESFIAASAGVRHVIDAAAERAPAPDIDDVEGERRVHVERRMQRGGEFPRLEAHTRHELA